MKIVIIGSVKFRSEMVDFKNNLNEMGHEGIIHPVIEDLAFNRNPELMKKIDENHAQAKKEGGYIKWYHENIQNSDAVLVLNYDKNGIKNYIGGNTLMEMGFAHVNDKKVYLLNPVPEELSYSDEIKAMLDVVLNGDLNRIN